MTSIDTSRLPKYMVQYCKERQAVRYKIFELRKNAMDFVLELAKDRDTTFICFTDNVS